MHQYPRPPDQNDAFWFLFTGFFAMLGVLTKMIMHGDKRSPMAWLGELLSVGFWGGLSGWIIAYYTTWDTPLIAGISAMLGHLGHAGLIYFFQRFIMNQIGGPGDKR